MNVLILSTYENAGGAAIAASRLRCALQKKGVSVSMLTAGKGCLKGHTWQFLWERLVIFARNRFSSANLWAVDIANAGEDVTASEAFRNADIIHLHWINQGFLSMQTLEKIVSSGKTVVWTMHDAWNSTGICHLTMNCENYREECGRCMYLAVRGDNDLSHKIWKKKHSLYSKNNIRFVSCSEWLREKVLGSKLMARQDVVTIPNPIDISCYYPCEKAESRHALGLPQDKKLLLFVAQGVNNPNKGMQYLIEAMRRINGEDIALVMLGGKSSEIIDALDGITVCALGYVTDTETIRQAYSSADAFVLPSLSENLPNTIMEAMACGTPCVGFRVGGIPEMISHKQTGYVAEYRNAGDLASGILYVLDGSNAERLSQESLRKVRECYSEDAVASKYIELYSR